MHVLLPICPVKGLYLNAGQYITIQSPYIYVDRGWVRSWSIKRLNATKATERMFGNARVARVRRQHIAITH